jgi:phage host-nuclease inhibitor protein Gam
MARLKPKNTITSKAQAEAAMMKLNSIDTELARMDLDEAEAICAVREKHNTKQREAGRPGMEAEKALLIKELEAWAEGDQATWGKRSIETPFGMFGFRVGQPTVSIIKKIAKSFDAALELLKAALPGYVRDVPQIDKAQILADNAAKVLDEEALRECGLEVKQDDEFWVETAASKDLETAAKKLRAA